MARPRDTREARIAAGIRPEPPEAVREAILAALAAERAPVAESAWWRAGVDEAVTADDGD